MIFDPTHMFWILMGFAFAWGASWGSFINVVIYRLPQRMSLVKPPSHCPSCETKLGARDNIPIFGWLILRGRCRFCDARISPRYPLIEALMAGLAVLLTWKILGDGRLEAVSLGEAPWMDLFVPWVLLFAFLAALVTLFFIDLDITELPPEITGPGIALGLIWAFSVPEYGLMAEFTPNPNFTDAAFGAIVGGGIIMAMILGYYILTGRVGMGGGDIWMMAMVGAFLGWQSLFFIYLASSAQGIVVALVAAAFDRDGGLFRNDQVAELEKDLGLGTGESDDLPGESEPEEEDEYEEEVGKLAVPFGPFIAVSAVEYLFLGEWLLPLMTGNTLGPHGFLV